MVPLAAEVVMSLESRRHARNPNRSTTFDTAVSALVIVEDIDQPLTVGAVAQAQGTVGDALPLVSFRTGIAVGAGHPAECRQGGDSGRQLDMNESPEGIRWPRLPTRRDAAQWVMP